MAKSYIITIKFEPSNNSLKETEKKLNNVFSRVTQRFKNGFSKVWGKMKIGAGLAAMTTAIMAIINPMSALNDRINQTLTKAGNLKDRAQGAGTNVKNYAALQGYAVSKGINEDLLSAALARVQTMVGAAKGGEQNALYQFRNETDMAKVFYNVMNRISEIKDPAERAAMASSVFGQKALTQLGPLVTEGFNKQDFAALLKGVNLNAVEKSIYKLDERSKQQAVLAYKREMNDLIVKGNTITSQTITAQDKSEQSKLKLENTQLKSFADIANVDHTLTEIKAMLSEFFGFVGPVMSVIKVAVEGLSMIPQAITDTKDLFDMLIKRLPKWLGGRG